MGLLDTYTETNRVIDQGDTYTFTTEVALAYNIGVREEDMAYFRTITTQWRGIVHYAKSYRYVGLYKDTAESAASAITNAYTKNIQLWGTGVASVNGGNVIKYMVLGTVPICGCTATPVHVAGNMWEVQVSVDVSAESYTDWSQSGSAPPTIDTLKTAVAAFTNFPEIASGS